MSDGNVKLLRLLLRNKQLLAGGSTTLALIAITILAPVVAPYTYWQQDYGAILEAPGPPHYFGTDDFGRDTFTRVVYGGRASLLSALGAAGVAAITGIALGLLGGYLGGSWDALITGLINVTWSFPSLLLALFLVVISEPGLVTTMIAIGLGYWPQFAQVIRAEVRVLREREFVLAARAVGAGSNRIILRHILPNVLGSVIVLISLNMGYAIIVEATLSFLGLGVQPPTPSWGTLLSDARQFLSRAPW
ncbi:MAG: ABC transporter permease, partial [bacterium]